MNRYGGQNIAQLTPAPKDKLAILESLCGKDLLKKSLADLMDYLDVLDTTRELCRLALQSPMADFEDALVAESARNCLADYIVTRDPHGFADSPIKAIILDELSRRFAE